MYNPFWVLLNSHFWQDDDLGDRVKAARAGAPRDILTKLTRILTKAITSILIILLPIAKMTSAVAGCLIVFTIGFLSFVFLVVWLPMYHILIATSWLWLKAWYLRPILLIPGVVIAFASDIWVILTPDFRRHAKQKKQAMCEEWPLSWYLVSPPEGPKVEVI
jgi:hypothetical protein